MPVAAFTDVMVLEGYQLKRQGCPRGELLSEKTFHHTDPNVVPVFPDLHRLRHPLGFPGCYAGKQEESPDLWIECLGSLVGMLRAWVGYTLKRNLAWLKVAQELELPIELWNSHLIFLSFIPALRRAGVTTKATSSSGM